MASSGICLSLFFFIGLVRQTTLQVKEEAFRSIPLGLLDKYSGALNSGLNEWVIHKEHLLSGHVTRPGQICRPIGISTATSVLCLSLLPKFFHVQMNFIECPFLEDCVSLFCAVAV